MNTIRRQQSGEPATERRSPGIIQRERRRAKDGAVGVDRISVEFFTKDSQKRLLAVKEHLKKNTYQPGAIRPGRNPQAGEQMSLHAGATC